MIPQGDPLYNWINVLNLGIDHDNGVIIYLDNLL